MPEAGPAEPLEVTIADPDLCPRYCAQVFDVRVGPSPQWLADRLMAAGVRPISNIVDVTNYVLLELGQPMHAFDYDRLAGRQIVVRRARAGERLRTLDGVDRALEPDMLVIADGERASAVGGVMGGHDSEIGAVDAAHRARERVLPPAVDPADEQAAGPQDRSVGSLRTRRRHRRGTTRHRPRGGALSGDRRRSTAGINHRSLPVATSAADASGSGPRGSFGCSARTCPPPTSSGFSARLASRSSVNRSPTDTSWQVTVPTFRVDVAREADLIEEVGRHYGFDRLPITFPALTAPQAAPAGPIGRDRLVRQVLTAAGFSESATFAFLEKDASTPFLRTAHRGRGHR